ncbi:SusC/RagA family TonB-linked outer membrane protein [Pedobacter sp.]|uniref:SusC/RagA family TonB-linked outer membrane protein n=1 Tax=Pedobacter sp. TaxID=1411316 RepID=UPI003D7F392F
MNNFTKKVVCIYMPLFCFHLSLAANGKVSIKPKFTEISAASGHALSSMRTFQNTRKITGVVKDENGSGIPGVNVVEEGTTNGTTTDSGGNFELTIKENSSLKISYTGFVTQTLNPGSKNTIQVTLKENRQELNEVLVVAFGKTTKEAFTGSAGVLKSEDLQKSQVSNPLGALAGRVAGVQLNSPSSQPGSSPSITIRGFGSISSATEPLIVVDGMPFEGDMNLINAADIETMTVLKDAASNALYGARGANGVVMITTKKGNNGEARINFDTKVGVNSNGLRNYKTMDAQQFYETYYTMLNNFYVTDKGGAMTPSAAHLLANQHLTSTSSGVGPGYMIYSVPDGQEFIQNGGKMNPNAKMGTLYSYNDNQYWLQADDWAKEGLQTGLRQEYNTSISGASDKINYYTSLGYLNQEGIQEGSSQERLTARLKLDYEAKKWLKVGGNTSYSKYNYMQTPEGTIGGGSIWAIIKTQAPIYPVYYRDANKNIMIDKWGEQMYDFANNYDLSRAGGIGGNAIFNNKFRNEETTGNSFIISGYADFIMSKNLKFTVNANAYDYDRRFTYINSPFVDQYTNSALNGSLSKSASRTFSYNMQQLLNYTKDFGNHHVSALLGHEYYDYKFEYLGASGYNFGIDNTNELGTVLNLNGNPNSYANTYNNEGYFFRTMYDYDAKYFVSASYRRDASSRFATENRWGDFWSVGGAWLISKEDFFNASWVSSLKLKASIGSQGNDNIGDYLYADSYNIVNNGNEVAYQWRQKGSRDITWETNTNLNIGTEFDLFKGRLSGSAEYFYRKTSDMLFSLNTPPSVGYTSYYVNLGDMRNAGFEMVLNAALVNQDAFKWNVNFNISHVKNKVLSLPSDIKTTNVEGNHGYVNLDKSFVSKYKYFVAEGLPLYNWFLPKFAGVDQETGESLYYKDTLDPQGVVTGQTTTKDASQATDYLIGDALPEFYGGFGTTVTYRGIDLSVNLNYQIGGKAYDYTYQTLMHTAGTTATNWHVDMLNAWTPSNKNAAIPRLLYAETYSQSARSDRFITDASYLNIQNINLGYTLPTQVARKYGMEKLRIYLAVENPFYFSARQGFDPRYSLQGFTNPELYSPIRTFSGGLSLTF